ncbi:MAG: hypothetical protein QMD65_02620 [Patescibacteria group bacterium]|nr:hypothetical protein [Patescibacteria group bacterium]
MKNFVYFLVMIFVFAISANAQFSFGFKVEIDPDGVLKGLGIGQGTDVVIENITPFYMELIAENKTITILNPCGTAIAKNITTGFYQNPILVVGKFYSDLDCKNLVGMVMNIFWIKSDPYSEEKVMKWVIRLENINFIDSRYNYWSGWNNISSYPMSEKQDLKIIKLPTSPLRSITSWQFANNTLYEAVIEINGRPIVSLKSEEIYFDWKANDRDYPLIAKVVVRFYQERFLVGYWDAGQFEIIAGGHQGAHPYAVQFLISPDKIQRPY